MMDINNIKEKLKTSISPKKFLHSLNVMKTSLKMAKHFGEDELRAMIGGLLHDCAKTLNKDEMINACKKYKISEYERYGYVPSVLHGPVGSKIAKDIFMVDDIDILNSIYYHTTGRPSMSMLEKIVYLADYIEPSRMFEGVEEIRKIAFTDIDLCVLKVLDKTLEEVIAKGTVINVVTVEARNYYLEIYKRKNDVDYN